MKGNHVLHRTQLSSGKNAGVKGASMVWIPSQMEVDGEVSLKGEDGADVGVALGSGDGGRGGPSRLRLENEGNGCLEVGGGGGGGAGVEGEDGEQWPSRLRLTNDGISAGLPRDMMRRRPEDGDGERRWYRGRRGAVVCGKCGEDGEEGTSGSLVAASAKVAW